MTLAKEIIRGTYVADGAFIDDNGSHHFNVVTNDGASVACVGFFNPMAVYDGMGVEVTGDFITKKEVVERTFCFASDHICMPETAEGLVISKEDVFERTFCVASGHICMPETPEELMVFVKSTNVFRDCILTDIEENVTTEEDVETFLACCVNNDLSLYEVFELPFLASELAEIRMAALPLVVDVSVHSPSAAKELVAEICKDVDADAFIATCEEIAFTTSLRNGYYTPDVFLNTSTGNILLDPALKEIDVATRLSLPNDARSSCREIVSFALISCLTMLVIPGVQMFSGEKALNTLYTTE